MKKENSITKKITGALLCSLLSSCSTIGNSVAKGVIDTALNNTLGITDEHGNKANVIDASVKNYIAEKKEQKKRKVQKTKEILKNY